MPLIFMSEKNRLPFITAHLFYRFWSHLLFIFIFHEFLNPVHFSRFYVQINAFSRLGLRFHFTNCILWNHKSKRFASFILILLNFNEIMNISFYGGVYFILRIKKIYINFTLELYPLPYNYAWILYATNYIIIWWKI